MRWSTPVDLTSPPEPVLIHYGSPVITPGNTVIIPIRTSAANTYRVDARKGGDGALLWTAATSYVPPPHNWKPSYGPALAAGNRVWFAGAGGTVHFRDNLDASVPNNSGQFAFHDIAAYHLDPASFNATVFVNTPITADASGAIYFGFRTTAGAPLGLASGIARVDAAGIGTWIAATAAAGDPVATLVPHQAAPALSNDESTLYVVVTGGAGAAAYLVGLDPATLTVKESSPGVPMRVALKDPRNGGTSNALTSDNSSASPMIGPDGDVYYGVLGNPFTSSRGWLLHFSADLAQTKTPGGFGWDSTPAVVPAAAVPSYTGTSSYLVFTKYNDYPGSDGGNGVNRIAVLDPNDTMVEPHPSSNGTLVMREGLSIAGPTPDPDYFPTYPNAVREWCINAAAVDPITGAVMANSEDGKVYRWDLATNTLSQAVTLSPGIGEAYTSTLIGPDGTVYATNWAILNAVGSTVTVAVELAGSGTGSVTSSPGGIACGGACSAQFFIGQAATLNAVPDAGSVFTGWLGACTGLGPCQLTPQGTSAVSATFAPDTVAPLRVDVDGNGAYDALTDGLLALRYLFGLTGLPLTAGALGDGATRTDPGEMADYLNDIRPMLDVDGNGIVDALTDGVMLIRYLFDMRGPQLIAAAIGPDATRTTEQLVESYIQSLLPLLP
ncbi:MAG: hypothetical protein IPI73_02410 [Betaproteobacteria bacterium]|nr:hypothetical protein [Betaproteobacteria bacterium]